MRFGGKKSLFELNALSFDRSYSCNLWVDWRLCELSTSRRRHCFSSCQPLWRWGCQNFLTGFKTEFNRRVTKEFGTRTLRDVCGRGADACRAAILIQACPSWFWQAQPLLIACLCGALAGACGAVTSHPIDTIFALRTTGASTQLLCCETTVSLILNSTSLHSRTPQVVAKRFQALTSFFEEP